MDKRPGDVCRRERSWTRSCRHTSGATSQHTSRVPETRVARLADAIVLLLLRSVSSNLYLLFYVAPAYSLFYLLFCACAYYCVWTPSCELNKPSVSFFWTLDFLFLPVSNLNINSPLTHVHHNWWPRKDSHINYPWVTVKVRRIARIRKSLTIT